eukprot:TRINITY_DN4313_c0_g1_i2.p1 TRINITY_DN4313_c0_g1~~TRINITY_DN4313_c0_g1_i2.p1  ORF type:complete len:397 (+),score=35.45 TRINITY_DN4313_c0_g1_i2:54-1193(+)
MNNEWPVHATTSAATQGFVPYLVPYGLSVTPLYLPGVGPPYCQQTLGPLPFWLPPNPPVPGQPYYPATVSLPSGNQIPEIPTLPPGPLWPSQAPSASVPLQQSPRHKPHSGGMVTSRTDPFAKATNGFVVPVGQLRSAMQQIVTRGSYSRWPALYHYFEEKYTRLVCTADHGLGNLASRSSGSESKAILYAPGKASCPICLAPRSYGPTGHMIHLFRMAGEQHRRWPRNNAPVPEFVAALARLNETNMRAWQLNTPTNVIHGCAACNYGVEAHLFFERGEDGKWHVQSALPDYAAAVGQAVGDVLEEQFSCVPRMAEWLREHATFQKNTAAVRMRAAAEIWEEDQSDDVGDVDYLFRPADLAATCPPSEKVQEWLSSVA